MMGIEHIQAMAEDAGLEAKTRGLEPYVYGYSEEISTPFPFPHLGDYVPEGWELEERHFVDSSGMGDDNEPALTFRQFIKVILDRQEDGPGWAVLEVGQFQLWVGEFRETS